jgi:serine/threonine protein kinase
MNWDAIRKERPVGKALILQPGTEPYPGYILKQFLGRGGWGEVWKAEHSNGKFSALKFLPSENQHAAPYEVRALQAIRQLKHQHLLQMEQIWSCPGYLVIVMEVAEGNLHDLLDVYYTELNTPILPEDVCYFLRQAADAIDFLNARQHTVDHQKVAFRHCDIKPTNILLVNGKVRVGDFSLAFKTTSHTGPHARRGTMHYAAPEVFMGMISDKSDQFSLAVSYYQLRTGRFPFPSPPANFTKGYVRPAPDLSRLTADEQRILGRGLSNIPQDRWPSCVEMMNNLSRCFKKKWVA